MSGTNTKTRNGTNIIMATNTTTQGLVTIDPIQGLVDYVNVIKPYHTKVFETLVEYVYTDYVNVSIVDVNNLTTTMSQQDALDPTFVENNGTLTSVPTSIIEAFDFFVTAPSLAPSQTIVDADPSNYVLTFTGNITSDVQIGSILQIANSTGNDGIYNVLGVAYETASGETTITLNTLVDSSTGTATFYNTDTTYNFSLAIQSTTNPGPTVTDPAGQTLWFTNPPVIVVKGNATRAIQAGSVFSITGTTSNNALYYYAVYVTFVPGITAAGQRNPALDLTTIGIGVPNGAPSGNPFATPLANFVTGGVGGSVIPYNITGYDGRYDGPYDAMAGYQIISD